MKLDLLDIEEFIQKKHLKQVTTSRIWSKGNKLDPQGLFSEVIFGKLGSDARNQTFAYIDLKANIIHPEAWKIVCSLDPRISKMLTTSIKNKKVTEFYTIEGGEIIKVDKQPVISGIVTVCNAIKNNKLNYDKLKGKSEAINFVKKNYKKVVINKFLVIPAGIRDISIENERRIRYSDLNNLYEQLIRQTEFLSITAMDSTSISIATEVIQRLCIEINNWIKGRLKGKQGLIRGGILKKTVDYSGRFVIVPDTNLDVGQIELPWQYVLKLYEKFAVNYILFRDRTRNEEIKSFLKLDRELEPSDLERLFTIICEDPTVIPEYLKEYFIHVAEEIAKNKQVLYKRDPVEDRSSWIAADIRVGKEGYVAKINPIDCERLGADFDGDTIGVYSLYTKEAQEEARKKLNPRYTKSQLASTRRFNSTPYVLSKDAVAVIYAATR